MGISKKKFIEDKLNAERLNGEVHCWDAIAEDRSEVFLGLWDHRKVVEDGVIWVKAVDKRHRNTNEVRGRHNPRMESRKQLLGLIQRGVYTGYLFLQVAKDPHGGESRERMELDHIKDSFIFRIGRIAERDDGGLWVECVSREALR